jgi:hypothetical protein
MLGLIRIIHFIPTCGKEFSMHALEFVLAIFGDTA